MVLVFFLSIFIILLIYLLLFKICITIDIVVAEIHIINITFKIFKIFKYNFTIKFHADLPKFKIEYIRKDKSKTIFELKKKYIKKEEKETKKYLPLLKNLEFKLMDLSIKLGLKDAYKTSMICGFINTSVYSAISIINEKNKDFEYNYYLTPFFEYPIFNISLNCIICLRLANIIYEFIKIKRR